MDAGKANTGKSVVLLTYVNIGKSLTALLRTFVFPPKFMGLNLMPNVMIFGDRAFRS